MGVVLTQHVEITPGVLGGKPHITGHRIRVLDIVVWHEKRGLSPDEILSLYPSLTLADVYAALTYYFDHRDEIELEFEREAHVITEMKTRFPSKLEAKLRG